MFVGYCVKGRHKVRVNGKKVVINGREFLVGVCPQHKVKVYRIVGLAKKGGKRRKSRKTSKKRRKRR